MPTDIELYVERHITYGHLSGGEAANMLAHNHNLSSDSLRGRLSRVTNTPPAEAALIAALANDVPQIPLSVERQEWVLSESMGRFNSYQFSENRLGAFVSDLHMPYNRIDAYQLVLTMLHDLKPNVISALNDELDNEGYGKHDDANPIYTQLWRSDFAWARRTQNTYHKALKATLAPHGQLLGLMGNHDRWIFNHWRIKTKQTAEKMIADYMEALLMEDDVLMFSRGIHENIIELSKGLVWVHGLSAAANPTTIARNGFKRYMRNGRARSFVQGHTHRPAEVYGDTLGYHGIKFINSGHLRHDTPAWLVHKPQWGMGIVLCQYNPVEWAHDAQLVRFVEDEHRNCLYARYEGQEYTVPLNKSKAKHLS